jgi:PadR family transcriptional regulator, regulatory protein PadR
MQPLSRVTAATIDVLDVLASTSEAAWGLAVIKSSGRPAGTVYPILERLENAGWVTSSWEEDNSRPGPRRRYYQLTDDGGGAALAAITGFRTQRSTSRPSAVTAREIVSA